MTDLESLQAWLAIEHEAVWVYGVIGGRRDDLSDEAKDAWNRHRDTRDRLEGWIRVLHGEPVGPQMGYALEPIDSNDTARVAAQSVEGKAVAATVTNLGNAHHRVEIVAALRASARARAEWGAAPSAFPGLDA
ncbi:MAG: DUF4439 domain-containing protein [Aeromicrobium sp.]